MSYPVYLLWNSQKAFQNCSAWTDVAQICKRLHETVEVDQPGIPWNIQISLEFQTNVSGSVDFTREQNTQSGVWNYNIQTNLLRLDQELATEPRSNIQIIQEAGTVLLQFRNYILSLVDRLQSMLDYPQKIPTKR